MRGHHLNYLARREQETGRRRRWYQLADVGFWLHNTPRLLWRCWLFGHRPVVDGTQPTRYSTSAPYRWVVCDRCGKRGDPQGSLNPATFHIGDVYRGPWEPQLPQTERKRAAAIAAYKGAPDRPLYYAPGPIPRRATGQLGGQLVVGGGWGGPGFELKVGNCGSEHTLAARLSFGWLGTLYLHTEDHGQWLQRWLNPVGYESKIVSVDVRRGRIVWRWWIGRDSSYGGGRRRAAGSPPWWRDGELRFVPPVRDWLLGKREITYFEPPLESFDLIHGVGAGVFRCVRLHDGDYLVKLKLQQVIDGRARWRRTVRWEVDWSAQGRGIPTEGPESGRYWGSAVDVSERAVTAGTWPAEAVAAIAVTITQARTRGGWEPSGTVPVLHTTGAAA